MIEEIYVIIDTHNATFWKSANDKTSWPSVGTAKSAFGSSRYNPLRCLYSQQDRFKIAKVTTAGVIYE